MNGITNAELMRMAKANLFNEAPQINMDDISHGIINEYPLALH